MANTRDRRELRAERDSRPMAAWEYMMEGLRDAMTDTGLTPQKMMQFYKEIVENPDTNPSDRLRAIDMMACWSGWKIDRKEIKIETIKPEVITPEGLEDV